MRALGFASSAAIAIAAMSSTSHAAPTAPAGWTMSADAGVTTYRASQPGIEIHLFDPAPARGSIEQWFAQRRTTPPVGLAGQQFVETTERNGIYVAVGAAARGNTAVLLATLACAQTTAGHVYAELITPQDVQTLKSSLLPAITVIASQCGLVSTTTPSKSSKSSKPTKPPYAYRTGDKSRALAPSKIAAMVHSWYLSGGHLYSSLDIALTDGTVRRGLPPVAIDEFDVAAEKQGDPSVWGQWKRNGTSYQLKFDKDKAFSAPANESLWIAAKPGEQLSGSYEYNDSQIGPFGYYRRTSISFTGDRFSRSWSGGSAIIDYTGTTTSVGTTYNEHGSATTISGPNVGGGTSSRSNSKDADRQGTYRIDGYVLELHYDNGVVERRFFAVESDRSSIFFNGSDHHKPRPKPKK